MVWQDVRKEEKHSIRYFFVRFVLPFAFPAAVFGALFTLVPWSFSHSEPAQAYPSECLGGWKNPKNATGKLSLPAGSPAAEFNKKNSAVLQNSLAQIFCGGFSAEKFSESSFPKKILLKFSWAAVYPPDTLMHFSSLTQKEVFASPFLEQVFSPALAEASSDRSENTAGGIIVSEETSASSSSVKKTPEIISTEDFLQILYSFDGNDWKMLGSVARENLTDISFQVPIRTNDEIARFQVSVQNSIALDDLPVVFLDGMWLEAWN
jgi:hypothetical protein